MLGYGLEDIGIDVLESKCEAKLTLELRGRTESNRKKSYQLAIPSSAASLGDIRCDRNS